MDEKLRNNFWYADWSFPIFVGLLSAGVFAGTHMFYLYGVGAFNEVAFVAMLKAGMDTGAYGAVAAFGASFLFARIIEGSLVGILDIGGAIQTGVGLGVPALLLGAGIVYPVENFGASLVTGMAIGLAIGYVIIGTSNRVTTLNMPHIRPLEGKLWEMRMTGRDGIARARKAIASGAARAKLDEYVAATQALAAD